MPRYTAPTVILTPQQVVTCQTTGIYDAIIAWFNAADPATKLARGVVSVTGVRNQRKITIVYLDNPAVDINTDVPISTVPEL